MLCAPVVLPVLYSMQIAPFVLCMISSSVAWLFQPHVSTLSHKRDDFRREKVIEHRMCIINFSTTVIWNICHPSKNSAYLLMNINWSSWDLPVILLRSLRQTDFLDRFSMCPQISNFMKFVQWKPSCSTRTDKRTHRHDDANRSFLQIIKTSQKKCN